MDEGKYLIKGHWYFTGKIAPYSTVDPSFYMPLSFYSVAPMEWLFGVGYLPGRVLMIVLHLTVLYSLISLARGLAVRLAGVGAVVLNVGYPVTLTYFATGSRRCRPSISATISSPASPITTKVKDNGGDFIFTANESSHPAPYDFIKGAEALSRRKS
jgi:hypothetical protein